MNKADARQELQVRLAREHNLTTAGKRHTKLVELVLERGLKARERRTNPSCGSGCARARDGLSGVTLSEGAARVGQRSGVDEPGANRPLGDLRFGLSCPYSLCDARS